MEELTERIKKLVNSDPNKPLTPFQIALIEEQIRLAFPVRCIPTHPTYASVSLSFLLVLFYIVDFL